LTEQKRSWESVETNQLANEQVGLPPHSLSKFFDLIVIDQCHRGGTKDDSAWREILTYFKDETHICLIAIPKETNEVSIIEYFCAP